jgi:hypothetical protein
MALGLQKRLALTMRMSRLAAPRGGFRGAATESSCVHWMAVTMLLRSIQAQLGDAARASCRIALGSAWVPNKSLSWLKRKHFSAAGA